MDTAAVRVYSSRRFVLSVLIVLVASALAYLDKVADTQWAAVIIAVVTAYYGNRAAVEISHARRNP